MAFCKNHEIMRIAILGANGQIGRVLFETLEKNFPAAEILACVRKNKLHFEGVAGNHLQRSVVFDPLKDNWEQLGKLDVLINCIGAIDESKNSFEQTHILPVLKMIDNREKNGNPRIIQISALGASANSVSRFLRTKYFAESCVLNQKDAFVIRPSIVCTSGTMLVKSIRRLQKISRFTFGKIPVPQKFLQTRIQPVCPRDLGELICKIITGEIFAKKIDVVGADKISFEKLFQLANLQPLIIPQKISDLTWKMLRFPFRKFLSDEQYQLLQQDNISDAAAFEKIAGKIPASTLSFWENELAYHSKKEMQRSRRAFA
jgi:uncharacterized protein YbjT (DUF2867 family)